MSFSVSGGDFVTPVRGLTSRCGCSGAWRACGT